MKFTSSIFVLLCICQLLAGQTSVPATDHLVGKAELQGHLMYLASDELGGRRTTSEGGAKAAIYIAKQLEEYGVKPAPGQSDFFQEIPFEEITPPVASSIKIKDATYQQGDNMLILKGGPSDLTATAIFAGHGWVDAEAGINDYENLDVKGKIVFVLPGKPDTQNPFEVFKAMSIKQKLAEERGAAGLFELYRLNFPWQFFKN